MADRRHTDSNEKQYRFRSERMISQDGNWFFQTREGTFEGPFESERNARIALERYIHKKNADSLPAGTRFSLEPL